MRVNLWRGALTALFGFGLLSCNESPTAPMESAKATGPRAASLVSVPQMVISQVYGAGGNVGAVLQNDYVELFNAGTASASLAGWSVQYTSAAGIGNLGSASNLLVQLTGTVAPGQYYLVKLAGGAIGTPLPTPDATGTIGMAAGAGKVALVDQNMGLGCNGGLTPCTPDQLAHIIDLVGYGTGSSGADFFEGAGAAPTISTTLADFRANHGCTDTNNNSADFAKGAPAPRNSSTALAPCVVVIGDLDHLVVTGGTSVVVGLTTTLTVEMQDAAGHTITDPSATFSWTSAADATAHIIPTTTNTATITGQQAGGPVAITVSATSNGVTKSASPAPTVTVLAPGTIVPSTTVVSEIHYDNVGADVGEAIEIEGDAGASLIGWTLQLYDGNGGAVYSTTALPSTIPATCGARGVVVINFPVNGIQNGSPDGWALVNALGQVTEFKSYEGTFMATSGPAAGLTSTAIDADETTPPTVGQSVQRAGNGVWFGPSSSTFGTCNPDLPLASQGSVTLTSGKTQLAFAMQTQFFFGGTNLAGQPVASVVWSTSNQAIITVDQQGIITAKGLGTAKLIATAPDGATGTVNMTVYLAAGSTGIRLGHNTEFGEPRDADPSDDLLIHRQQYTVSYNPRRGGANWVSWNLDASHIGDNGRCPGTCYSADTALTNAGITAYTTADWVTGNQYDRGHMAPSADWTSSEADNNTTFFLSNFLPQRHELNAGPWEALENALRDSVSVANGSREAYIIAGGIFTNGVGLGTILNLGKIGIPDSTWKIVVITPTGAGLNVDGTLPAHTTVLAVNMPNSQLINADWHTYLTSVAKIERSTGYNFLDLIAESVQCRVEGRNCAPTAHITSSISGSGWTTIVGQPVTFSGSTSTDPDAGDVLSMVWSVNGSNVGTGATLDHTFASVGAYQVRLTVTDNGGLPNVMETTVTVGPRPAPSCGLGRFENTADSYACDPAPAGFYVAVTDATSPTPCAAGSFQPAIGQASCLPAPLGSFVPTTGSLTATPCAIGTFSAVAGAQNCDAAPVGSFVSTTGASAAVPCSLGTYQDLTGMASCKPSPAGSYVAVTGAVAATPCATGTYQHATGMTSCIMAPAGSYVASSGAIAATHCAAGSYQDGVGKTSCFPAPAGSYVATEGAATATPCAAGTYQDAVGSVACMPAAAGHFVSATGATAQTPCALGSYQAGVGATSCVLAPIGGYVAIIGATSATPCPIGMTTDAVGTTSASGCRWLPPAALTQLATDQLQQMVSSGQISSADASPISVSIDQAQKSIENGNLTAAKNQLGAAVNKVEAAVRSGKITASQGAVLIAALNLAIAHM